MSEVVKQEPQKDEMSHVQNTQLSPTPMLIPKPDVSDVLLATSAQLVTPKQEI